MLKISTILLGALIFASSLEAIEYGKVEIGKKESIPKILDRPYVRDYIQIGHGLWNQSINHIVSNDPLFEEGNRMLTDPSKFIQKIVPANLDAESKIDINVTKIVVVEDFIGSMKKLSESAKTYQNPVSAYEAVIFSIKMFGKGTKSPIASDMPILLKLMYLNEVCEGYMLYGDLLERNGNKQGAYDVYKKGTENTKCSGWYQSVLAGKLSLYKKIYK